MSRASFQKPMTMPRAKDSSLHQAHGGVVRSSGDVTDVTMQRAACPAACAESAEAHRKSGVVEKPGDDGTLASGEARFAGVVMQAWRRLAITAP